MPLVTNALQFLNLAIPNMMYVWTYLGLLVLALFIGLLGSMLAMRRYLKI